MGPSSAGSAGSADLLPAPASDARASADLAPAPTSDVRAAADIVQELSTLRGNRGYKVAESESCNGRLPHKSRKSASHTDFMIEAPLHHRKRSSASYKASYVSPRYE